MWDHFHLYICTHILFFGHIATTKMFHSHNHNIITCPLPTLTIQFKTSFPMCTQVSAASTTETTHLWAFSQHICKISISSPPPTAIEAQKLLTFIVLFSLYRICHYFNLLIHATILCLLNTACSVGRAKRGVTF